MSAGKVADGGYCGCIIAIIAFNLFVGHWLMNYSMEKWFGKTADSWYHYVLGVIFAEPLMFTGVIAWLHGGPYPIIK